MPKKKRSGRPFARGNRAAKGVGGRKGKANWDRQELAALKIDKGMITRYLNLNFHLTLTELRAKQRTGRVSVLEHAIIGIMIKAAENGDQFRLDFLFDRLVGRVPTKLEHEQVDPYAGKSLAELTAMKKALLESNEQTLRNIERENAQIQQAEREVIEIVGRASSDVAGEPDKAI